MVELTGMSRSTVVNSVAWKKRQRPEKKLRQQQLTDAMVAARCSNATDDVNPYETIEESDTQEYVNELRGLDDKALTLKYRKAISPEQWEEFIAMTRDQQKAEIEGFRVTGIVP